MSSAPPLLRLNHVKLSQTDGNLFEDVSFSLMHRDRVCLVGRNGTGKSTLLKLVAGQLDFDAGEQHLVPGASVGLLAQEPDLSQFNTVQEYCESQGAEGYRVRSFAEALGVDIGRHPQGLSGGEMRRASLVKTLAEQPDLLLLDEPTNHLDVDSIEWLEQEIKAYEGAVFVISHDRRFLENVSRRIVWLDRGRVKEHERGFSHFEAWSEEVLALEAEQLAKMDKLIAEETIWSRQGISARRKRNMGRMRRLWELRDQRSKVRTTSQMASLSMDSGSASGKIVIEATGLSKGFGERDVIKNFDIKIMRGDRVALVGPNGAGKSTLINLLLGRMEPDSGTLKLGTNLAPTLVDQKRENLKRGLTAWEYLADSGGDSILVQGKPRHVVTYMQESLFSKTQARSPVEALSGGERNRLTLAKAVANPSNLLVLDEPTNDLDLETLDLLQEMLSDYSGTLLLVSHDRDFIDRLATSTVILDGKGGAFEYPGGYSDALEQHQTRLGAQTAGGGKQKAKPAVQTTPAEQTAKSKKLTYAQEIRLQKLPGLIEGVEAKIKEWEAMIADPDLYASNPERFQKASEAIGKGQEKLGELEEEWLELEEIAQG